MYDVYDVERDGDVAVLVARRQPQGLGRVVGRRQLDELLVDGVRRFVLDLSELRSIDSTGVGQVVVAFQKVRETGGELVVSGMSRAVRRVFEVTLIESLIPAFDDRDAARASFSS